MNRREGHLVQIKTIQKEPTVPKLFDRIHNTQHNDIQYDVDQHNNTLNATLKIAALTILEVFKPFLMSVVMLNVTNKPLMPSVLMLNVMMLFERGIFKDD